MTGIIVCPDADDHGETDPGASREFLSQARMVAQRHGGEVVQFDNESPMPNRGAAVLNALAECAPRSLSWFATCCHGWGRGVQAGFDLRAGSKGLGVAQLVIALARVAAPGTFVVPLYSCSTAEDPERGFAAQLSRGLAQAGVSHRLYAHTNAGHCCRNPYVRVWDDARRGDWLVGPGSDRWRAWVHALHDGSGLEHDYPFSG